MTEKKPSLRRPCPQTYTYGINVVSYASDGAAVEQAAQDPRLRKEGGFVCGETVGAPSQRTAPFRPDRPGIMRLTGKAELQEQWAEKGSHRFTTQLSLPLARGSKTGIQIYDCTVTQTYDCTVI